MKSPLDRVARAFGGLVSRFVPSPALVYWVVVGSCGAPCTAHAVATVFVAPRSISVEPSGDFELRFWVNARLEFEAEAPGVSPNEFPSSAVTDIDCRRIDSLPSEDGVVIIEGTTDIEDAESHRLSWKLGLPYPICPPHGQLPVCLLERTPTRI